MKNTAAEEKQAKKTPKKNKNRKKRLGILMGLVLGGLFCLVFLSQQSKLDAIYQEQATLSSEKAALEMEKERIEYMIEYAQSEEYILQYAREKLGFVRLGNIPGGFCNVAGEYEDIWLFYHTL